MNLKRRLIITLLTFGLLLVFLMSTDPTKIKVGWLIVPFILLFITLFYGARLILDWLNYATSNRKKQLGIASLIAIAPTAILLLDSINQLTLRDSLLVIFVAAVSVFYVTKFQLRK